MRCLALTEVLEVTLIPWMISSASPLELISWRQLVLQEGVKSNRQQVLPEVSLGKRL
jgi:hypothetical protein